MKLARCDMKAGFGARPCDVTVPFIGTCHGHAVTQKPFRGCHEACHAMSRGMSRSQMAIMRQAQRETFVKRFPNPFAKKDEQP
jgi:hypothetical protein